MLQGSWVKKIMDRVYNLEKGRKRKAADLADDTTPRKRGRPKRVISLISRYPPLQPQSTDTAQEQQVHAIMKEMDKEKPRKDILLPLMKATFYARRQYILDSEDSVLTKLEKFPALKMSPMVCLSVKLGSSESCDCDDRVANHVPFMVYEAFTTWL